MIIYQSGITRKAKNFVDENIHRIGTLHSIQHERNSNSVVYETTFKGEEDTMVIKGGLGSGYRGEGPTALVNILTDIGISRSEAEKYVYENHDNTYSFEIKL